MYGRAALQQRYTEVRLTSCTRRHASRSVSRIESSSGGLIPALLNAMSSLPYFSTAVAKSRSTSSLLATSVCTYVPPTSAASASPASSLRSATTTVAPSCANRRTVANPMPEQPPVTTATLPSSLPAMVISPMPRC